MPDEPLAVAEAPLIGLRGRALARRTRKNYGEKLARFDRYQATHPELTLTVAVRTFLASIPPVGRRNVVAALRARDPGLDRSLAYPPQGHPPRRRAWRTPMTSLPTVPDAALPPEAAAWSPWTRYRYARAYALFERFQTTCPDAPLAEQVRRYLATQRRSCVRAHRTALKARFRREVDWTEIPRTSERRDVATLRATLLDRPEDRARLEAACVTTRDRVMVELCYVLRRTEITRLRWADLDLDRGIVSVFHGKGDRSAWTLLTPAGVVALRRFRADQDGAVSPEGIVLQGGMTGRATLRPYNIGTWFRSLLIRAGLARRWRGPHALRRTFASLYIRRNPGDLSGLKALMRHSNLATTTLYIYDDPDDLAARMAGIFDPRPAAMEPGSRNGGHDGG